MSATEVPLSLPPEKKPRLSSVASSTSSFEDLKNKFIYLKHVKDLFKSEFPDAICALIFGYFSDKDEIAEFLQYVAEGEQDKVEIVLEIQPELLLRKGVIKDFAGREFKSITAFQYALWARDWHMWKMLLQYMSKEIAALQYMELEEKGTAHDKYFNLQPLIEALNTYAKNWNGWSEFEMEKYWCEEIRKNQLLLPVHVVNEYCHPNRAFYPCPKFDEEKLLRNRKCSEGDWYTSEYQCETGPDDVSEYTEYRGNRGVGKKFAIVRSKFEKARAIPSIELPEWNSVITPGESTEFLVMHDVEALQSLWRTRQLQLENLKLDFSTPSKPSKKDGSIDEEKSSASLLDKNDDHLLGKLPILTARRDNIVRKTAELEEELASQQEQLGLVEIEIEKETPSSSSSMSSSSS